MDEARRVIERLERIERLKRSGALPSELLGEIRSLLAEGESWLAAERAANGRVDLDKARTALERCRRRIDSGHGVQRLEVRPENGR
jgi:hypothetical protein